MSLLQIKFVIVQLSVRKSHFVEGLCSSRKLINLNLKKIHKGHFLIEHSIYIYGIIHAYVQDNP